MTYDVFVSANGSEEEQLAAGLTSPELFVPADMLDWDSTYDLRVAFTSAATGETDDGQIWTVLTTKRLPIVEANPISRLVVPAGASIEGVTASISTLAAVALDLLGDRGEAQKLLIRGDAQALLEVLGLLLDTTERLGDDVDQLVFAAVQTLDGLNWGLFY